MYVFKAWVRGGAAPIRATTIEEITVNKSAESLGVLAILAILHTSIAY